MSSKLPYESDVPEKIISDIRVYMGDLPEFNRLVEGTEISDEKIKLAVQLWLDSFNNSPPMLIKRYTPENFNNYLILFHGAIIEIMKMAGIVQSRNTLRFNDGGAQFTVQDKGQEYMQWLNTFMRTHAQDVKDLKMALNAESAYDQHDSPEGYWGPI